jgi:hypothetical protein
MADKSPTQAVEQVGRIESMRDFMNNPAIKAAVKQSVPVSMPAEAGSLGFDIALWVGLGMGAIELWRFVRWAAALSKGRHLLEWIRLVD